LLTNIFRSPETGTFGQNIGQMYARSNPQQQAGILNKHIAGAGPGLLSTLGINIPGVYGASPAAITPEQTQQISPAHVEAMANVRATRRATGLSLVAWLPAVPSIFGAQACINRKGPLECV